MHTYRTLLTVMMVGLAACETMPTGPTPDAPAAAAKLDNNGKGAQFAPNPFPALGSFDDADGDSCIVGWTDETGQNDFLRTGPKGAMTLHVSSNQAQVDVIESDGTVWTGVGTSSGHATFGATTSGFTMLVWRAQARVTNLTGEVGTATCHVIIDENGQRQTRVEVQ